MARALSRTLALLGVGMLLPGIAFAQEIPRVNVSIGGARGPHDVAATLQIILLLTVLSLAPAILLTLTSFVRVVIVLAFTRSALGIQQVPPNQVIIGLALFLTFFLMQPVWKEINSQALQPYLAHQITLDEAVKRGEGPVRAFLFAQTRPKDLGLFLRLGGVEQPRTRADVPTYVLAPAFLISELKTAFQMGFMIYVPFLVIDIVVAVILLSMGMMMLPPVMISLPFKVLLFVMVDGWNLVIQSLMLSFR
ncbi:MAG TPA: flagellar type III secretion system pore protein FliP [Armatimonadetes bacterium]|jgi:flagellar biosynthetic protein FliP|nr:flagellar type III secretion system pore protein FliP [Armatimonadota bacterium]